MAKDRFEFSDIKWSEDIITVSRGRNGVIQTTGLSIHKDTKNKMITLNPITSKGDMSGAAAIEIPESRWIGTALDAILAQKHLRPLLLGLHPLLDEMLEPLMKGEK